MQLPTMRREAPHDRGGTNGGFPEPTAGEPVRVVACTHDACGTTTRVRLPASVPVDAVHRVVCEGCGQSFEGPAPTSGDTGPLAAIGASLGSAGDRLLDARDGFRERLAGGGTGISRARLWTWAAVPIAALGVLAGLALLQGDSPDESESNPTVTLSAAPEGAGAAKARFVEGNGFSLALPSGWEQANPPDGAAFAASSEDGLADATLWIEEDPDLSFREFEQRSLEQLGEIGSNPRILDRVQGPTIESTITELRADAPVADGVEAPIRVTLRGAGDYRLFFSTTVQPGASADAEGAVETLHASLRPDVTVAGPEEDG